MSGLRRYAPFSLLVAAQIVLVILAPSKGATQGNALGGQFGSGTPGAASSSSPLAPGAVPSTAAGAPPAGAPAAEGCA